MKKYLILLISSALCCSLTAKQIASEHKTHIKNSQPKIDSELRAGKLEILNQLHELTLDVENTKDLVAVLKSNPQGIALESVIDAMNNQGKSNAALNKLSQLSNAFCKPSKIKAACEAQLKHGQLHIPELWLYEPRNKPSANKSLPTIVAMAPQGDESHWTYVEAIDTFGNQLKLDPRNEPEFPVIVLETQGSVVFQKKVGLMNDALQKAGLQSVSSLRQKVNAQKYPAGLTTAAVGGIETTMLKSVSLQDDKEPWIKGAAEIYMITSGVKNSRNEAEIQVTPLHYLDYDGTVYTPNQLVLFWDDYAYAAANIQLFEEDNNTNYQNLVQAIIRAIGMAGSMAGQPEITAITEIAGIIVEAMPSEWFQDNDDYVDTCYTLIKSQTYRNHQCAAGNARLNLEPFWLSEN